MAEHEEIILLRLCISWWFIPLFWIFYPVFWLTRNDVSFDYLKTCKEVTNFTWNGKH